MTKEELKEIRIKNLKKFFENKMLPEKDRSLISQLYSGKISFGEKVSRRLERENNMGEYYLDTPENRVIETALSGSQIALEMPDNSFAPHIPQGSELLCDTSQTAITDGKIYQIQHGNLRFIRRVFRQISGSLKLSCDNPSFDDTTISPDQIQIIGRIVQWQVKD